MTILWISVSGILLTLAGSAAAVGVDVSCVGQVVAGASSGTTFDLDKAVAGAKALPSESPDQIVAYVLGLPGGVPSLVDPALTCVVLA